MRSFSVGRIESETPESAREWLNGIMRLAAAVRADENLKKPWRSDPLEGEAALIVELAKAILLLSASP